ncbi:MAG: hypothetical protein GY828_01060 [Candidatus Gracilibacteria bacterium]|nr:hypothetical protein [Candidatus Gracilibacteria bacterium]
MLDFFANIDDTERLYFVSTWFIIFAMIIIFLFRIIDKLRKATIIDIDGLTVNDTLTISVGGEEDVYIKNFGEQNKNKSNNFEKNILPYQKDAILTIKQEKGITTIQYVGKPRKLY